MANINKIMDRIKKLLALSSSSNPNEASVAAAKAAELMAEHELEEADLRVESGEANQEPIDDTFFDGVEGKRMANWKSYILAGLIKAFHCHGWYDSTRVVPTANRDYNTYGRRQFDKKFRIVGRRANIQTCNYMYLYLVKELEEMSKKAWRAVPATTASLLHSKHWVNSFLVGAAGEIQKRLLAQVEQVKNQPMTNAMVLVRKDQEEVDLFFNQVKPKLRAISTRNCTNSDAYSQGKEAGAKVNLGSNRPGLSAAPLQLGA